MCWAMCASRRADARPLNIVLNFSATDDEAATLLEILLCRHETSRRFFTDWNCATLVGSYL